jgi:hypothetical protein
VIRRTSIEVYRKIKEQGLLSKKRAEIYFVLFPHGPMTGNEIFRMIKGVSRIVHANIHSRLNEMEKLGVAERIGTRTCTVTGNNVDLWDVTDDLPKKVKKPKRVKCTYCKGKGYIEQGVLL